MSAKPTTRIDTHYGINPHHARSPASSSTSSSSTFVHFSREPRSGSVPTVQTHLGLPSPVSPSLAFSQHWSHPPASPSDSCSYLPTPPETPLEPLPSHYSMFYLPTEILDAIFARVPTKGLPTLMRVNSNCHALAERLLYFKVQHIQLFPGAGGQCSKHWQCLETLASRPSAARAVRHFGVKGLPWLTPEEIHLLSRVLSNMVALTSLSLDLGAAPEQALLTHTPSLSLELGALNVHDAMTAMYACTEAGTSVSILRINSSLDAAAVKGLLKALSGSTKPLLQLQMKVECRQTSDASDVLRFVTRYLPQIATLGLVFDFTESLPCDKLPVSLFRAFKQMQSKKHRADVAMVISSTPQKLLEDAACILSSLQDLEKISLAFPTRLGNVALQDAELLSQRCRRLEYIELQWSAWRLATDGLEHEWTSVPETHKRVMRNRWAYEHAFIS